MNRGTVLLSAPLFFAVSVAFSGGDVAHSPPDKLFSILRRHSEKSTSEEVIRAVHHELGFQALKLNPAANQKLPCLCSNRRSNFAPALRRIQPVRMTRESEISEQVSLDFYFDASLDSNLMVIVNVGQRWFGTASENSSRNLAGKDEL